MVVVSSTIDIMESLSLWIKTNFDHRKFENKHLPLFSQ